MKMGESHVLSGLVAKRSELAGRVEEIQQQLAKTVDELRTLEKAIRIYDPSYDLRSIRTKRTRKKSRFFEHGEASRFVLDALRETDGPISTNDMVDLAAAAKSVKAADLSALRACVLATLSRQRINRAVVEVGRDEAGSIKWRLAD
jgi:hypothetical protein